MTDILPVYPRDGAIAHFAYVHHGLITDHHVEMFGAYWGTYPGDKEPQWLLRAFDRESREYRTFAMRDIRNLQGAGWPSG